ncbi:MAG TPA: SPOR domain-containing protein, partial [Rhizomicrobium sp.]|nr:SPOR domain-containing protein [Rhizomicrobium sp.]
TTTTSDPDDEAAAESRVEPDEVTTGAAPVASSLPAVQPAEPRVTVPSPAPVVQATVQATLPPAAAAQAVPTAARLADPARAAAVPGASQLVKAQISAAPMPIPRPASPIVLAAYNPRALPAALPRTKPQPVNEASANAAALGVAPATQNAQALRNWTIQIGAFADATSAKAQLSAYAERSMDVLGQASRIVIPFQSVDGHTLFRARFGPFGEREAREVCERLTERGQTCFAALSEH